VDIQVPDGHLTETPNCGQFRFSANPIVRTFPWRYISGIIVLRIVRTERKSTMAKKPLDAEEIAELRSSPYVASIIGNRINFTPEFKRMAYDQITSGKTMREVFEEHGIDPEILGDSRVWGFAEKLRAKAEREEGFADLRGQNMRKPAKETKEQTLANRVEQLEHELAYTRQEVEFLKKIHTADLEARKLWESKQHRK
jgi:transposase-like protein